MKPKPISQILQSLPTEDVTPKPLHLLNELTGHLHNIQANLGQLEVKLRPVCITMSDDAEPSLKNSLTSNSELNSKILDTTQLAMALSEQIKNLTNSIDI